MERKTIVIIVASILFIIAVVLYYFNKKKPSPTEDRWSCSNTGQCVKDPNGKYESAFDCEQDCKAPVPGTKYTCNDKYQCVQDPKGILDSCDNSNCRPPNNGNYWWFKTQPLESTTNNTLFTGNYAELNDSKADKYNRIVTLTGPSKTNPGTGWNQINASYGPIDTLSIYDVINALSTAGLNNVPSDYSSGNPDKGVICPQPKKTNRINSFSNQFTAKGGSDDKLINYSTILNYISADDCKAAGLTPGCAESGRFFMDSGAITYDSPIDGLLSKNVYTCSNHILNGGSRTSSFPGSLYYEDFYDSNGPVGVGMYDINGKNPFPYTNQQSIPISTQNITLIIYDNLTGTFNCPDSVSYMSTTGDLINYSGIGNKSFPVINDIIGFISEPNVVCKRPDVPWSNGIMGANSDYSTDLKYIPSCFNVGYPLAEAAKKGNDGKYIPTISGDQDFNFTADQGIVTIKYKTNVLRIKNDLSIIRNNSDDKLQTSSCFIKGLKLPFDNNGNVIKYHPVGIQKPINVGDKPDPGILSNVIKGLNGPCYNPTYNDSVIRMNLSNSSMTSGNNLYLVISFDYPALIGNYTLLSSN